MMPFQELLRVFFSSFSGRLGILFLGGLLVISVYALIAYPLDYGRRTWYNPEVWADFPKNAPPAWLPGSHFSHRFLDARQPTAVVSSVAGKSVIYSFPFRHDGEQPPSFLALTVSEVVYHKLPPFLTLSLSRPDGHEVILYQFVVQSPHPGEMAPFRRYANPSYRVLLSHDDKVRGRIAEFLQREFALPVQPSELRDRVEPALFGVPQPPFSPPLPRGDTGGSGGQVFQPLVGDYVIALTAFLPDPQDRIGQVRIVLGGTQYGLMGTDALGRDLAQGLLFGFPVALTIGIVTAVLSTILGASLGLLSGYAAGRTDTLIQRLADVVSNIPVLPILIFLVFVLGSRLWLVILLLVIFGWPGLTILTRSMVLQIRTGPLVEATRALGASRWRIMFRHIAFQIAPYLLAQLVFSTPAAILAEAALSFLGLGDPSLPTWGQILEQGFRTGAVYLGYWRWVLPPGLLIVATAMTFVFITLGLEPVVNPRLRRG